MKINYFYFLLALATQSTIHSSAPLLDPEDLKAPQSIFYGKFQLPPEYSHERSSYQGTIFEPENFDEKITRESWIHLSKKPLKELLKNKKPFEQKIIHDWEEGTEKDKDYKYGIIQTSREGLRVTITTTREILKQTRK